MKKKLLIQIIIQAFIFLSIMTVPIMHNESIFGLAIAGDCSFGTGCTKSGEFKYPLDWFLYFGEIGNTDGNGTKNLDVSGSLSCPPYIWTIHGSGFKLAYTVTQTPTNTVIATGSCGTATIIAKDNCGAFKIGYLRSKKGKWHLIETCGVLDGWHYSTCYIGAYKYVVEHFNCNHPEDDSGDICSNHPCCGCSSYYCGEGSEKWGWDCEQF